MSELREMLGEAAARIFEDHAEAARTGSRRSAAAAS